MADKIVQWQEKVGAVTFDNLIPETTKNVMGKGKLGTTNGTTSTTNRQPDSIFEPNSNTVKNATNATNSTNATNAINAINKSNGTFEKLEIDSNGKLKYGNIIIPQKKVLWSGNQIVSSVSNITLSENISIGDILQVKVSFEDYSYYKGIIFNKFQVRAIASNDVSGYSTLVVPYVASNSALYISQTKYGITSSNTFSISNGAFLRYQSSSQTGGSPVIVGVVETFNVRVLEIAKIIE